MSLLGIFSFNCFFVISTVILPFLILSKYDSLPLTNKKGRKVILASVSHINDSFKKLKYPFNSYFSFFMSIFAISAKVS